MSTEQELQKLLSALSSVAEEESQRKNPSDNQESGEKVLPNNLKILMVKKLINHEISNAETNRKVVIKKVVFLIQTPDELNLMVDLTHKSLNVYPFWLSNWVVHIKWFSSVVPQQMARLQNVEVLDLSRKSQVTESPKTELPHFVGLFKELKILDAENNMLTSLPPSLQLCRKLEVLKLRNNRFIEFPGFLLNFPSLQQLTRHDNCFFHFDEPEDGRILLPDEENLYANTAENNVFHCDTLCKISAINAAYNLQHYTIQDVCTLDIPKNLKVLLNQTLCDLNYCDNCSKIVTLKDGWVYTILAESIIGYNRIPLRGTTCSQRCANIARERIINLNKSYVNKTSCQSCFDVNIEKSDHMPRRKRMKRIVKLFNRIKKLF